MRASGRAALRARLGSFIALQIVAEAIAAAWLAGGNALPGQAVPRPVPTAVAPTTPSPTSSSPSATPTPAGPQSANRAVVLAADADPGGANTGCGAPATPADSSYGVNASRVIPPRQRWALVIGVTDYEGRTHSTIGGAADAALVADVLVRAGWLPDHILVLTERAATAGAVCGGLRWLAAHSGPDTFSFLHYSGHVQQKYGHRYLWPVDNSLIRDTTVAAMLAPVAGRAWFDFAGCESAGFARGIASPLRLVTSSSRVDEKSYEVPAWGESVWAGFLFDRGIRARLADANGDGVVTVAEALSYAVPNAPAYTALQRPYGPQHPQVYGGGDLNWSLSAPPD